MVETDGFKTFLLIHHSFPFEPTEFPMTFCTRAIEPAIVIILI